MSSTTTISDIITESAVLLTNETKHIVENVVDLHHLPKWMQKDVLISRGYRKQSDSLQDCCRSLFYVHNETVNIWGHFLMGLIFLSLLVWTSLPLFHDKYQVTQGDLWAFRSYLLGATVCLFFSAFYHCVSCHSVQVATRCLKLDYLGIVFNISSTCISATHFGLRDDKGLANFYVTLIVVCAFTAFWAVLDPNMDGPNASSGRAIIFILLGASGFAPILHVALSSSMSLSNFPLTHIIFASLAYLLGTVVYVSRTPEKFWPGVFDIWGASHQIFHTLVNVAQISHLLGLWGVMVR